MMRAVFLLLLSLVAAEIAKEDGVMVLNGENFNEAITENNILLVEFYAPWCGHCKQLAPEYSKAAGILAQETPPIALAKCDATQADNKQFGEKYDVEGFPTLKLFRGGKAIDYDGGRQTVDIVNWMKKRAGPACRPLNTVEEAENFILHSEVGVIGFFGEEHAQQQQVLTAVAEGIDSIVFHCTSNSEIAAKYGVGFPAVTLFKKFDGNREDVPQDVIEQLNEKALEDFLLASSIPLVQTFSQETSSKIFGNSVKTHMLFFLDTKDAAATGYIQALTAAAEQFKGKALHIIMPEDQTDVMNYFSVTTAMLPIPILIDMGKGMKQYRYDQAQNGPITVETLAAFEQNYHEGQLRVHLKSADRVDDSGSAVKTIVGADFDERVVHGGKDVLLEFYAPWCGHCKALQPKFEELANEFAGVESVMIGKMDATENDIDHPEVDVQGFPTLKFFPAKDSMAPIDYNGEREVEAMAAFIKKEASIKFDMDGQSHGRDEL